MEIVEHTAPVPVAARFSILIPTWNNLPYLKLCLRSLKENSSFPHEVIVHVNDGTDGSLDWVKAQGISYTHSSENVGVCHALNAAAKLAQTDFICFFNDDMYALPEWDASLWQVIEGIGHEKWFVSATMIEPRDTGNRCVIGPLDYGQDSASFREQDLLRDHHTWPFQDWSGATWPPNVVPRRLWEAVGGYSEEFTPGMSSDPDFSMKLWQAGVRYFRGVAASRVYHFQTKSTGKVTKNDGPRQFLQKWGITQGTFGRYYLRRGEPWRGQLQEAGPAVPLLLGRLKAWFKSR